MKIRLDQLLVARGLAESREAAQRLILAGKVYSGEARLEKAGRALADDSPLEVRDEKPRFVSRGGLKLEGALAAFAIEPPAGCLALDIGASTGGFTDCLLQRGAGRVIALDVGHGQLHERIRSDPRVTVIEKVNARSLDLAAIGGAAVDWIVIDVSFISLRLILPPCRKLLKPDGKIIALVKPQFEAGKGSVRAGGIIRDRAVHRKVLEEVAAFARGEGWDVQGLAPSPIQGTDGNIEFFIMLGAGEAREIDVERVLEAAYNAYSPAKLDPPTDEPGTEP